MTALLKNESLDEVFRKCLEEAVNGILQAELSAFLGYEKYGPEGYGSGDSRNGSYERAGNSLFRFYEFPPEIRASIYTTNLIERSNKGLKHLSKIKEQFPNEDSLDRFVCGYCSEANRKYAERAQKGFLKAASELLLMFEQEPTEPDGIRREAA